MRIRLRTHTCFVSNILSPLICLLLLLIFCCVCLFCHCAAEEESKSKIIQVIDTKRHNNICKSFFRSPTPFFNSFFSYYFSHLSLVMFVCILTHACEHTHTRAYEQYNEHTYIYTHTYTHIHIHTYIYTHTILTNVSPRI